MLHKEYFSKQCVNSKYYNCLTETSKYQSYLFNNHQENKSADNYLTLLIDSLNFSNTSKNILSSLNNLLDNNNLQFEDVIRNIDSLINESKNNIINLNELSIVLSALYTGENSISYWYKNKEKWEALFPNTSKASFNWSSAGKADISGAVGGGIAGALVGGTTTLGALTVPGWVAGAVGGGIGNSACNAVAQLLDSWW